MTGAMLQAEQSTWHLSTLQIFLLGKVYLYFIEIIVILPGTLFLYPNEYTHSVTKTKFKESLITLHEQEANFSTSFISGDFILYP
jgi:hypothetical protein